MTERQKMKDILKEEGDYYAGEHKGYKFRVMRIKPQGHLCGYVLLPENHTYYGKSYNDMDIEVHGGLTYASETLHNQPEEGWWIGFDTAHLGDVVPEYLIDDTYKDIQEMMQHRANMGDDTYKDMDFCIGECKRIIDQL